MAFTLSCASTPSGYTPPQRSEEPQYKVTHKGPKKRVGIVAFENKSPYGQNRLGSSASDILTTELFKTKAFIIIERGKLDEILKEQRLGATGVVNPATAAQAGKVLGLNAIVTGSISEFGIKTEAVDYGIYKKKVQMADCSVDIRVVDATTGQLLYADSGKGHFEKEIKQFLGMGQKASYDETMGTETLRTAIVKFMDNLIQQLQTLEWTGRIASITDGKVYINAGKSIGLKVGDTLKVIELGKEIFDPETHVVLGRAEGPDKGTLTVSGFSGDKLTIATAASGIGAMKVGDIVKYVGN
jgi:curli biogenesis system outer membrane secretion channel CsgG